MFFPLLIAARWRPDLPASSPQSSSTTSTQPVSLTPRVLPIKLVSELDSPSPLPLNSMTSYDQSLSQAGSSSNNTTGIINTMDTNILIQRKHERKPNPVPLATN